MVKAVVIEGVQGAFRTGDRASLYRAAAACDAPIAQLVDGLLLPGGVGLCGRGFRVCGDGAVFVPPLGAAAVEAGVTLDGGAAFACSRTGNYGRAALVSGLPVRGTALKACGLATCRLVYKGDLTRDPSQELSKTKLRPGAKCLVMRARR